MRESMQEDFGVRHYETSVVELDDATPCSRTGASKRHCLHRFGAMSDMAVAQSARPPRWGG